MEFATAQEALGFVTDQTYRINAEVYAVQYPELNYAELVPSIRWAGMVQRRHYLCH
jgi:hypothetical protein